MEKIEKKRGGKEPPDPEILKTFSANLKSCIPTNEWLAGQTGLSPQAVADYVNGVSLPRADFLLKISKAVNKSIIWLLTGQEKSTADCPIGCTFKRDLCKQAKNVLESKTKYETALIENLEAFDKAVNEAREAKEDRRKAVSERKHMKREIGDLRSTIFKVEKELAQLKAKSDLKTNTDTV